MGEGTTIVDLRVLSEAIVAAVTVKIRTEAHPGAAPTTAAPADGGDTAVPVGLHRVGDDWDLLPATWDAASGAVAVETTGFSPLGFTWLTAAAIDQRLGPLRRRELHR